MPQAWQVRVTVPATAADPVAEALEPFCDAVSRLVGDDGADGWRVEGVCAGRPDRTAVELALALACAAHGFAAPGVRIEPLADRDWLAENLGSFRPVAVGRYRIRGSHVRDAVPAGCVALTINAATAFGTGAHASTAGCLLALDALARRPVRRPLDLGCGSGVLALAMAKTWRIPVRAADRDPEAVRVARANAAANGVGPLVRVVRSNGYAAAEVRRHAPYDLITANILARPLMRLAPDTARHLAPGGITVLAGFVEADGNRVLTAHRAVGLRLVRRITRNGWQTLVLRK